VVEEAVLAARSEVPAQWNIFLTSTIALYEGVCVSNSRRDRKFVLPTEEVLRTYGNRNTG